MEFKSLPSRYSEAIRFARGTVPAPAMPRHIARMLRAHVRHGISPRDYCLYDLDNVPDPEWGEYVVDGRHKPLLSAINRKEHRALVKDKVAFAAHCQRAGLPSIPILATIDPAAPDDSVNAATSEAWLRQVESFPDRTFVKRIDGALGADAFRAERNGDGWWSYAGITGSAADLHEYCLRQTRGMRGWLIQPAIHPHAHLSGLSTSALSTLRAVTLLWRGETELVLGTLRIPTGASQTDNFSHGTSGNLVAPVDMDTGELGTARGSSSRHWPHIVDVPAHPDSGVDIRGFRLPFWTETRALLLSAQQSLPQLPSLGWDIAITDTGPLVVEANSLYDLDLMQVAHRRGLFTELVRRRLEPLAMRPVGPSSTKGHAAVARTQQQGSNAAAEGSL
jgi:hypothetical protein